MRIATNNVVASFATGRAAVIVTRGTAEQPFFLDAARTVTVPLMRGSANLTYTENDQLQAVALPFRAPGMSMIVILPKKVDGLAEVEASLSVANLDEWIRGSPPGGKVEPCRGGVPTEVHDDDRNQPQRGAGRDGNAERV
jgi:hypothetical protein